MNKIDEIMGAAQDVADAMAALLQRPSGMREIIFNKEVDGLRTLIAAALAEAERKGAEAMRAEIEAQEPAIVEAGELRIGFGDTQEAVWLKLSRNIPLGTKLYARPVPAQAALEEARRDGAEQMREAAADRIEGCDQETERWEYAEYVRALPLPTGSQS